MTIDEIRARAAAATPGPWRWGGNVDHDDPRLIGARHVTVLGHLRRDRERDDREARSFEEYVRDMEMFDLSLNGGDGGYRYLTEEEVQETVRDEWLTESNGEPRHDDRLAFPTQPNNLMEFARDLAVYEVCRDATSRDDERVYRADIVGLRNPNAVFIAAARQDVDDLLAEVDRLNALLAEDQRADTVKALESAR